MKLLQGLALVAVGVGLFTPDAVFARKPNYDESLVKPYKLEDPLVFVDGHKMQKAEDWVARRREILGIFQREMYGQMPPPPENITLETFEEGTTISDFVIRRQIRMWFNSEKKGPKIDWLLLIPKFAKGPVPVILFLNYRGNQEVLLDKQIPVCEGWSRNNEKYGVTEHKIPESTRGAMTDPNCSSPCPVGMLTARGYAVATACYCDVSPDPDKPEMQDELAYTGIFELWGKRDPARDDNTTALAAWAWALMRGVDMLGRQPEVDARQVVVTGCSRLGKAALIAGAFDDRFAVVVPNQTGGGGAPLAKRDFGENISTEMRMFTHWYCKAYGKYVDNEDAMPFDQHLLLACVAPRPLLILGFDSPWFDTKGEYLACTAASPVWKFLGKSGLPDGTWPDDFDTSAIGRDLGYVRRPGPHGISFYDWTWLMDFADRALGRGVK
ncbi:MAG: acetylxylan esterase [Kiritimatiellae bacterium]|nr:acetylxylan esterase [Kiritimatiellia bacterium]